MPLVSCEDCGREISTAAPACPHCGRPAHLVAPAKLPTLSSPTHAEQCALEGKQSTSYIARHWRGKLSLPRSFWLDGALLSFGVLLAAMNLVKTGVSVSHANSRAGFAFVLVGYVLWFLITIPVAIWQLVGIARSATNYTGPRIWEILAKSFCGLGWLAIFHSLTHVPAVVAVIVKMHQHV